MSAETLISKIRSGEYDVAFARLYGEAQVAAQRDRYICAVEGFAATFGEDGGELRLFSAPGRTEIGGNHTDHNYGRVLAGSVNLDVIAVVRRAEGAIRVQSAGYPMDEVKLDALHPVVEEMNRSASLIRGTAARFDQLGYAIGGFEAYTTSNVLKGSGLSSSAAFEVLMGVILNYTYNDGRVSPVEIAQIAQYAENAYFGKPCGLMDQMASSVGNIITIDFADPAAPVIEPVDFDFASTGYALCIVDVGGNHADLTDEYAAVPGEMKAVAASLGVPVLRQTTMAALLANITELREKHGDRAVLRAIHFLQENERVTQQVAALRAGDFDTFKKLIIASGNSSFEYLQNVYAVCNIEEQGMSLALALAQTVLDGCGAWRVHGGGFGGTTQNFVPLDKLDAFKATIEQVFGEGSCHVLSIRPCGGVCLDAMPAV
ncbi:MAG: galactokinase [Clostridia bacterium]|nr:galactokinase [Clostridia bacterium]